MRKAKRAGLICRSEDSASWESTSCASESADSSKLGQGERRTTGYWLTWIL